MLETIVDICAVMGFLLSVCIALRQQRAKRTCIAVRDVRIYERRHADKPIITMRLSICNLSESPLSIVGIGIRSGKRCVHAYQPRMKIASLTNHFTGKTEELFSSEFPINLAPQESRCIYAVFPSRHIRLHKSCARYHPCIDHQGAGRIKLRLETSRKIVRLTVCAATDVPESILAVLRENCR